MANLLEEASILLTPTAYNNGRMLAVKPEIAFGGELIVNGDFSDGTNNWINNNSTLSVVNGKVKVLSSSAYGNAEQNILVESGKTYRVLVDFTYGGAIEGRLNLYDGSAAPIETSKSEDGIISTQITISSGQTNLRVRLVNQSATTGVYNFWDNVSVKEDLSGDFTFSRNSAATRVNAQGLVENVQILSSNLVSNGDFSQEGSELVTGTNSDMSGANSWVDGIGSLDFNINTTVPNKMWCNFTSGNQQVKLNNVITANKTYLVSLSARLNSGTATTIQIGDFTSNQSDAGILNITPTATTTTYSGYIVSGANVNLSIGIITANNNGSDYEFDNISVKEVGQDWTLGTGWSIGEDKAVATSGTGASMVSSIQNKSTGRKFKFTFQAVVDSGIANAQLYGVTIPVFSTSGFKEYIITSTSVSGISFYKAANFSGSLTNISVIEITDDTNLPRINYEGFSYQDSLGSEEVVNGDFATDTNWIKQANWSISGGNLLSTNSAQYVSANQNVSGITLGKTYQININVNSTSGGYIVKVGSSGSIYALSLGLNTITAVWNGINNGLAIYNNSSSTGNISIDNVSVKEYLGQEVVPNSGCGSWLLEPQTTQIVSYSELFSNAYWGNSNVGTTPILETGFLAPDGTNNAFKMSNANQDSFWYAVSGGFNATTTRSIYARTVSGTGTAQLCSHNSNTNNTFTITEQWQRFELNATASTTGLSSFYAVDFRGSGTLSEIILWGANATNDQDYATSYIPTQGAISTRLQDIANNSGNASLINSEEGVLYAEISALADGGGYRVISIVPATGTANRIIIYYDILEGKIVGRVDSAGTPVFNYTATVQNQTNFNKIALKYKQNDFALWINGIELGVGNAGNTPIGLNNLSFDNGVPADFFHGKTKALAVFKTALTDASLRSLTYPPAVATTFDLNFNTIADDFTFTRGSEATFVNAQGLIQSTNEIGSELVTNGDFDDGSTGWVLASGWSVVNNQATTLGVSLTPIRQDVLVNGTNRLTFDVVEGGAFVYTNYPTFSIKATFSTVGTHTVDLLSDGVGTNRILYIYNNGAGNSAAIDNVSVKEYTTATNTPRLDYSTGAEAFLLEPQSTNLITESEAFDNAYWTKSGTSVEGDPSTAGSQANDSFAESGSNTLSAITSTGFTNDFITGTTSYIYASILGSNNVLTANKMYKISFTITLNSGSYDGGTSFRINNSPVFSLLADGNYSAYANSESILTANFLEQGAGVSKNYTVSNFSLKEVQGFASPSGDTSAFKLVENATTGVHSMYRATPTLGAVDYSYSVFAKAGENTTFRIQVYDGTDFHYALFNLSTGVASNETLLNSSDIKLFANGYYKCSINFTASAGVGYSYVQLIDGSNNITYAGDGTSGVYVWGAQLEQQSYATSYIPTSGASATRNQELCNDATPVINSEEGVLYAEISALANDGTSRVFSLSDGTSTNQLIVRYYATNNSISAFIKVGGSFSASLSSSLTATDFNKIAFKYKENDFALWVNGIEVATDSSGSSYPASTLNELSFDRGDGGDVFFGNTKGLKYYPKALADVQLQDLTTI